MPKWGLITYGDKVTPAETKGAAQEVRNTLVASGHDAADVRVARIDPPSQTVRDANERREMAAAPYNLRP